MANCGLCNRNNISFMGGYTMNGITGKVCEECRSNLLKLRSSADEELKQYFKNIIETTSNSNVANFLSKEIETCGMSTSQIIEAEANADEKRIDNEVNAVLLSTSDSINNQHIEAYGSIVTGISVLGTGFFNELNACISDMFGTASVSLENKISEAKDSALYMLKKEAYKIQCNAVVSTSISFVPFAKNIIGVVVTGTAVKVVPTNID